MDEKFSPSAQPAHNDVGQDTMIANLSDTQPSALFDNDLEKAARDAPSQMSTNANAASEQGNSVEWDGPQDPQNPQNWTSVRKWTIIILISAITFNQ